MSRPGPAPPSPGHEHRITTVKGCVSRLLDKLGRVDRAQAGLLARDAGLR